MWYFEFSSDRNGPCWPKKWKWSMKPFCHHINCYFTVEVEGWPPVGKKSRTVFPNRWRYGKGTVGCRSCSPWDTSLAVALEGPWMGWNGLWRSGGNLVANLSKFWQLLFIWQVFEALPNESSALWTREDVHFSSHLCSGQVWLGILWQDSPSTCTWWNGTAAKYAQQVQLKTNAIIPRSNGCKLKSSAQKELLSLTSKCQNWGEVIFYIRL